MSYEKLGFTSGQTLKAEHLNHMEEGIANAGGASSWNDLTDKPNVVLSVNDTAPDENGNVAVEIPEGFSGSWNDLTDKPFATGTASNAKCIAIGENSKASATYESQTALAIGVEASAVSESIAIGKVQARGSCSIAIGNGINSVKQGQIILGNYPKGVDSYKFILCDGSAFGTHSYMTIDESYNGRFEGTVEGKAFILPSSTSGSTKRFKITVDDSGTLSATEV
jgi:hypothetical protein